MLDRLFTAGCLVAACLGAAAEGSAPATTVERDERTIRGWSVLVHRDLLVGGAAVATARALELLDGQLAEIERVVPAPAVAKLREVPLYLSPEYAGVPPRAEYHPDEGWLREHDRDPAMAGAVEFTNVRIFPAEAVRMPNFALHELAHAYHHRVLPGGFGNPDVQAAFDRATASGAYDAVERRNGVERAATQERAYALTTPQEFFAETTEAFFSTNDFFPFTKADLARHDPETMAMLATVWGVAETPGPRATAVQARPAGGSRPNIVILYADDMGYGDLGANNPASKIPTPHLDRLAAEGTRFTDAHSSSGICTPSRYALLTGRHHWRDFHGIVDSFGPSVFKPGQLTLPEVLRRKGYATACIGKWHLGWAWDTIRRPGTRPNARAHGDFDWSQPIPGGPLDHGFDTYFGDDVINFPPYAWIENDRVVEPPDATLEEVPGRPKEGQWECRPGPARSDWDFYRVLPTLTERAEAFIRSRAGDPQPFLLYFPLPSPHAPIIPNDEFDGRSEAGPFGDFVAQTDDACGRVLAALRATGLDANTVVVFTADNGAEAYAYARDAAFVHWSSGPFRGIKRDLYEGGHHVPFLLKWPGVTQPGTVTDALVSQVDLMATLASAVGFDLPADAAVDSHDLLPWLTGRAETSPRTTIVHNTTAGRYAIRHGDWLLVDGDTGVTKPKQRSPPAAWSQKHGYPPDDGQPVELYDLANDVGQRRNLAAERPEMVAELRDLLVRTRAAERSTPTAAAAPATGTPPAKPSVLFIIADDASCHFGAYGCDWARTPAVDRLARDGIVFDNAYVPTSKCAPCRAAILTGRNPWQLEAAANHWPTFPPQFMAFTEVLAARGVACGAAGKVWGPGTALTAAGDRRTWGLATAKRGKGEDPGAALRAFLATRPADQPFFYWFGSGHPHRPYDRDAGLAAGKKPSDIDRVPAFWPDTDVVRRDMLDYATEVEAFDAEVGSLLAALDSAGAAEDTLVIVTSDHGLPFPRSKGHTFDLAHRVPLVMRWPAGIVRPGRRVAALVSAVDFAPTILELEAVDGTAAGMRPITGMSLVDLLRDEPAQARDRVILGRERNDVRCRPGTESGLGYPARAIRRANLFYVHNFAPDRWPCGDPDLGLLDTDAGPTKAIIRAAGADDRYWQLCFGKRPADELYDLAADPNCIENLAAEPARSDEMRRLREELFAELTRQEDPRVLGRGDMFDNYPSPKPDNRD